jgi:regulator of protease activity HflC (stomatin/prohibitin superfamily)
MFRRTPGIIYCASSVRSFFKVVPSYEKGVRLTLGNFSSNIESGLKIRLPFIHKIYTVDMRTVVKTLKSQKIITNDGVTITFDAAVEYKIIDANKAILSVQYVYDAILNKCQLEMKSILGSLEINEILHKRDDISQKVIEKLSYLKETWGVSVDFVQLNIYQIR